MENLKNKDPFLQGKKLVVALSGGIDSVVLLHYLYAHYPNSLRVVHCNHHLSKHCHEWHEFCQSLCEGLHVEYLNVDIFIKNKANVEENARKKRYHALSSNLAAGEVLCTAHHQNDQAETLLLQLFRGSGVAGLAAMPKVKPLGRGVHYRPLLNVEKPSIVNYAKQHRLNWVEDNSNNNKHFRRNFLRLEVIPRLGSVYKNLTKTLARSAKHQSEALQLTQDLALIDIEKHGMLNAFQRLNVGVLMTLDNYRLKNVIKYYLSSLKFLSPSEKVLAQIIALLSAKDDAKPLVNWGQFEVRRYKNELYFIDNSKNPQQPFCPLQAEFEKMSNFSIRYRHEGQRVRLAGKTHSQALKKVLQEAGVPPWERNTLRMYYVKDKLRAMERIGKMELC